MSQRGGDRAGIGAAKRFAAICLGLAILGGAGYFFNEQLAARRWRAQLPAESSEQQATSALTDSAIPNKEPPVSKRRRDSAKRTRCAKVEIEEAGSPVFRAQCPVGKTRCPWVSLTDEGLRVSGGYLPAQTFAVGPDTRVTCEEIERDGRLVERTLLPKDPETDSWIPEPGPVGPVLP